MIDFITSNTGFFRLLDGGFSLSLDWGFFLGIISTYLVLRYGIWRKRFPKTTNT